jgi:Got1/Sft2-like family
MGLALVIGLQKTIFFFSRKEKVRGTVCFLGGVVLVLLKWPFVGVIIEAFGFVNLFGYKRLS